MTEERHPTRSCLSDLDRLVIQYGDHRQRRNVDEAEKTFREIQQRIAPPSETAPRCPDNMPDVIDTLVDAERYRWFRDECSQERQIVIIEMSEGRPELLEHHIDKGRCGL